MKENKWLDVMDSAKSKHSEIASIIKDRTVAYIDIPIHFNVGDLLIYKGTEAFFKNHNINVVYRAGYKVDFSELEKVEVIVFHGGGNFGDLYDKHQGIREKVINKFKHKSIICMPQSVHFNSLDKMNLSSLLFNKHPDFYFFVRDYESFDVAKKFSNKVYLMPDMAHSLHPMIETYECVTSIENLSSIKIINLVRVDGEKSKIEFKLNKKSFDWVDIITSSDYSIRRFFELLYNLGIFNNKLILKWSRFTDDIVFKSILYFYNHDLIYTNRLHGFILSALLGKQVVLNDNSYNKNKRYFDAFMSEYPFIYNPKLKDNN